MARPLKFPRSERSVLLRRRMGWGQVELARILGVSDRTIRNMEAGCKVKRETEQRFEILDARHKLARRVPKSKSKGKS